LPESSSSLVSIRVAGGACTVGPAGACASATEEGMTATRAARSNITANTVRIQDRNVIGLPSIQIVNPGYRLPIFQLSDQERDRHPHLLAALERHQHLGPAAVQGPDSRIDGAVDPYGTISFKTTWEVLTQRWHSFGRIALDTEDLTNVAECRIER
jgi:hypothetical protein